MTDEAMIASSNVTRQVSTKISSEYPTKKESIDDSNSAQRLICPAWLTPAQCCDLPADVAADHDVAAEDSAGAHVVVDGEGSDGRVHRELDRARVHHADNIAGSGRGEEAEERPVAAILGVELDDLLVVVRALEELDPRVERPAVSVDEHLDAVHGRVKGVGAEGSSLDRHGGRSGIRRRLV